MHRDALKNLYTKNLGIKRTERVLVFTDLLAQGESQGAKEKERRLSLVQIAKTIADAGMGICDTAYLEYPSLKEHGQEPPLRLWEAVFGPQAINGLKRAGLMERLLSKTASADDLKKAEAGLLKDGIKTFDAIIALSNFSTSHTRFRDFLTRLKKVRYASMPLFDLEMFSGAMTADWDNVKRRTDRLLKMFEGADTVVITSHNGTSLSFSIKGRELLGDDGILTEPGKFGNLPAGEAFMAPLEGTAEGTLILEWAPDGRLTAPIELDVKKGRVVKVSGLDALATNLRLKMEENPLIGNIAELGIGTNDKATRPDNILETEKILGTVHVALGDNSSFGGKVSVPFHEDFIFFKPTLEVIKGEEKAEILVEGEPRF